MTIKSRLQILLEKIEKAPKNSLLLADRVTLLAACKSQPASIIREAFDAGIHDFGENRVQEAEEKWPVLRAACPGVRLHLIGALQTNKVKQAVALFDVIQTIDRMKLAETLADEMAKADKSIPCFIQVNTGREAQKSGVMPEEADRLIDYCKTELRLNLVGLMCVPPAGQPSAPHFASLHQLAQAHQLKELSMGMSDDFETAVRMGSSCVRLGRALFGERPHA
jgi:pyridoxal phosphate enzyme (YggS family)